MHTLTLSPLILRDKTKEAGRIRPRRPAQGPVFIQDCVIPTDHATLLLRLWQRWDQPPEGDGPA